MSYRSCLACPSCRLKMHRTESNVKSAVDVLRELFPSIVSYLLSSTYRPIWTRPRPHFDTPSWVSEFRCLWGPTTWLFSSRATAKGSTCSLHTGTNLPKAPIKWSNVWICYIYVTCLQYDFFCFSPDTSKSQGSAKFRHSPIFLVQKVGVT